MTTSGDTTTAAGSPPEEKPPLGTGSLSAPRTPYLIQVDGDIHDEAVWRRFEARHMATQTLSLQRAEWYARSTRLHVLCWFYLTLIGAAVAVIVMIAANSGDDPSSY